jgi:hypothetical protein
VAGDASRLTFLVNEAGPALLGAGGASTSVVGSCAGGGRRVLVAG